MTSSIMKAYDIRGVVGDELNEDSYYVIGAAIAEQIKQGNLFETPFVVGHDGRTTSARFAQSLIDALTDRQIPVAFIGLCTTPLLYFAVKHLNGGGGGMVTASHNPAEYNGLKFVNKDVGNISPLEEGLPIAQFYANNSIEDVQMKEQKVSDEEFCTVVDRQELMNAYIKSILPFADISQTIKIGCDPGNGVGSVTFFPLIENVDVEVFPINEEVDGTFPAHQANPADPETLKDLQEVVAKHDCDFGVAFDGDADRVGFVDNAGQIIPADIVGCLIADFMLEKHPGSTIVHDVLSTRAVTNLVTEKMANSVETPVGRHHVTKAMRNEETAVFGFEKSGHFFFRDFFGVDNAMMMMLHVASIVSSTNESLSALVSKYTTYAQHPVINITVQNPDSTIEAIKQKYAEDKQHHLDGVTVEGEGYRFTVRKSNTEPVIRLAIETRNRELLTTMKEDLLNFIEKS